MMESKTLRVLLIEDNPDNALLIHEELNDACGNKLELVTEGRLSGGLKRIKSGNLDVVLLDLSLPDSQGYNTFIRMRAHAPQIPIIVLSGNSDESLAIKIVQAGAQDFMVKGELDAEVLVRSIHYAIERQKITNELHSMLLTDRLTGLHNRRGLLTLAEQQIDISKREREGLTIIFVDLNGRQLVDKLKNYNVSDIALIETANILKETFRTSDIIGRVDSDEFVVVPINAHKDSARIMDTRLLKNVQIYNGRRNDSLDLSMNIGIAYYNQGEFTSFEELLVQSGK